MKPSDVSRRLARLIPARMPVLLAGPPGVGKSDLVMAAAEAAGADCQVFHPVTADPTDFKGLPAIVGNAAEFLPYGDLRALLSAERPTVAFLDDLGQAPAAVQAAAMQLILARRINGFRLPDTVTFIAATNRRQDKAGVTGILEPVKSRFATILELMPDLDDWTQWAFTAGVPAEIVAFLRFRPGLLHDFKATADLVNSPCPRTWANAGRLVALGLTDVETLAGAIGHGAATELVAFLRVYHSLPSIDGILLNPDTAAVPTDPSALYAVSVALASRASGQNGERVIGYASRLPAEFSVLCVRDAHRRCPDIANCRAFVEWSARNSHVLM
jgi:hypothetical protein